MHRRSCFPSIAGTMLLLALTAPLHAQGKAPLTNVPYAPVPTPMIQGKRAFISYLFTETADSRISGEPQRDYNEFYNAMKAWGRYQLVGDPKDADVIYTIRYNVGFGTLNSTATDRYGVVLWGFRMDIPPAVRQRTLDANFSEAILKLVGYIKLLVEGNAPPATP